MTLETHLKVAILGNGPEGKFWELWFSKNQRCDIRVSGSAESNPVLILWADIIVVAVPLNQIEPVSKQLRFASPLALIMSVCGLMSELDFLLADIPQSVLFVHKMALVDFKHNPEMQGIRRIHSRDRVKEDWDEWVDAFLRTGECQTVSMVPKEHDKAMAKVQGVIRVFVLLMTRLVLFDRAAEFAGSVITDMLKAIAHRVLSLDPHLNAAMVLDNPEVGQEFDALKGLIVELQSMSHDELVVSFGELKHQVDSRQLVIAAQMVKIVTTG